MPRDVPNKYSVFSIHIHCETSCPASSCPKKVLMKYYKNNNNKNIVVTKNDSTIYNKTFVKMSVRVSIHLLTAVRLDGRLFIAIFRIFYYWFSSGHQSTMPPKRRTMLTMCHCSCYVWLWLWWSFRPSAHVRFAALPEQLLI